VSGGIWALRAAGGVLGLVGVLMLLSTAAMIWTLWLAPIFPDASGIRTLAGTSFIVLPGGIVIAADSPLMGLVVGAHALIGLLLIGAGAWCILFRKDLRTSR